MNVAQQDDIHSSGACSDVLYDSTLWWLMFLYKVPLLSFNCYILTHENYLWRSCFSKNFMSENNFQLFSCNQVYSWMKTTKFECVVATQVSGSNIYSVMHSIYHPSFINCGYTHKQDWRVWLDSKWNSQQTFRWLILVLKWYDTVDTYISVQFNFISFM